MAHDSSLYKKAVKYNTNVKLLPLLLYKTFLIDALLIYTYMLDIDNCEKLKEKGREKDPGKTDYLYKCHLYKVYPIRTQYT